MPRPDDRVCLLLPGPGGEPRRRWWYIRQPRPTVAFSLQSRISAALGEFGAFAVSALFVEPEQAESIEADRRTVGEARAMEVLRRARSGRGIAEAGDMRECADRLWAVLRAAQVRAGRGASDPVALHGEAERARGEEAHRWTRPSLLYRLLLDSEIRFDGEGTSPKAPTVPGPPPPDADAEYRARAALRDAVADGSHSGFVAALDDAVCSPDEVALLCAWAVVHLWRPF